MSALPSIFAQLPSWKVGLGDWGSRAQVQWRGWARRWAFAVMACLLSWGAGMWLHADIWLDLVQTRQEVQALQAQLAAAPQGRPVIEERVVPPEIQRLPSPDQHGQMWTILKNALAKHRVQLISMQPVTETWPAPLPSHAMVMRLQARFENWVGLWAALVQMGPVWSMDRLRVVPSAGMEGVDIEVVWRIWAQPQHAGHDKEKDNDKDDAELARSMSAALDTPPQGMGSSVFESPGALKKRVNAPVADVQTAVRTADTVSPPHHLIFSHAPERQPMQPLRVLGIWRDGEQAEALLVNATHWFRIREGRQLSLEGHRVSRIGGDGIQVRDPQGRMLTLRMEDMSR